MRATQRVGLTARCDARDGARDGARSTHIERALDVKITTVDPAAPSAARREQVAPGIPGIA
jgi:hypothetical protein